MDTTEILSLRGPKNKVDPFRPYHFLVEQERTKAGSVEDFATIFLSNRECPFRCLMCDLWKNTTDTTVPAGAIAQQIRFALSNLPAAQHIKLYNSGNFFDRRAIPSEDHPEIAAAVSGFETVIVENHPMFTDKRCVDFQQLLAGKLEIAIGLETIQPEILLSLNKQMSVDDFARAVSFLHEHEIATRAFILLKPPGLDEQEGIDWALRSIEFAFSQGVSVCSVIPLRAGNGAIDSMMKDGAFQIPKFSSLEQVMTQGLKQESGRVFVDLWDAQQFTECDYCSDARINRLNEMNLQQKILDPIYCEHCDSAS